MFSTFPTVIVEMLVGLNQYYALSGVIREQETERNVIEPDGKEIGVVC